ncbi:MAG TPA: hypothetical protein VK698_04990 [Kofleriaceae bacterium]|nr:hypothetical protein [Kofleriaceae bacterium]
MTDLRLLTLSVLFVASVLVGACAADQEEPELGIAEVDRGSVALYAPGPGGGGQQWLDDDKGVLILNNTYDSTERHGHSQFRIYTQEDGVWVDVHVQTLCTDGNWVEGWGSNYVDPHYWLFVDVDCPGPYSVSEAWASVHLDY